MIKRCLFATGFILWTAVAGAQVTLDAVPGGVAEIPLTPIEQPQPEAFFGQRRILVMQFGSQWVGIVGLPLDMVPGIYVIQARSKESEDAIIREFTVYPKRIDEHPVVELPNLPLDVPKVELSWREPLDASLPLNPPIRVPANPTFGRYHRSSGLETTHLEFMTFRVGLDSSVLAPGKGRVAAVKNHETGKFVWIDHGMALFSCIGPLSRTTLSKADVVESGQSIGKVVLDKIDEPRFLYWSVFLNGTAINPSLVSELVEDRSEDPAKATSG